MTWRSASGPVQGMSAAHFVERDHRKTRRMNLQPGQCGGAVGLTARIQQHDGGLTRRGRRDHFIDAIDLLEDQIIAEVRTDLRPQQIIAGDEEHREFRSLRSGR